MLNSSTTMKPSKYCQPEVSSTRSFISNHRGQLSNEIKNILKLGSGSCFRWVSNIFLTTPMTSLRLRLLHDVNNMNLKDYNIYSIIKLQNKGSLINYFLKVYD